MCIASTYIIIQPMFKKRKENSIVSSLYNITIQYTQSARFPLGIALGCAPEKEEDKQLTFHFSFFKVKNQPLDEIRKGKMFLFVFVWVLKSIHGNKTLL